jgi:hypothetical protein
MGGCFFISKSLFAGRFFLLENRTGPGMERHIIPPEAGIIESKKMNALFSSGEKPAERTSDRWKRLAGFQKVRRIL